VSFGRWAAIGLAYGAVGLVALKMKRVELSPLRLVFWPWQFVPLPSK
jgi:hypothetical protein